MRLTISNQYFSGNRKSWFKIVESVDCTKNNGYAFEGDFVKSGIEVELPEGAIIIECQPTGSVKEGGKDGIIHKITSAGLTELARYDYKKKIF
jgi:hypothetical protein